jgi:hypothetical protein
MINIKNGTGKIPLLPSARVYLMDNGTTVFLYYWCGKWRMSSRRSLDVGAVCRYDNKTFMDSFIDCATKYPKFSWDSLDMRYVYCVGYHHIDNHPLAKSENSAWYLQAYDISDNSCTIVDASNCGLPAQELELASAITKSKSASYEVTNATALAAFLSGMNKRAPKKPHFGYVVVDDKDGSRTLFPSDLYDTIKKALYYHKTINDVVITPATRRKYTVLKALTDPALRDSFSVLFPSFGKLFNHFEEQLEDLTTNIVDSLRLNSEAYEKLLANKKGVPAGVLVLSRILAAKFNTENKDAITLTSEDKHKQSIVEDYIFDKSNLALYFNLLD